MTTKMTKKQVRQVETAGRRGSGSSMEGSFSQCTWPFRCFLVKRSLFVSCFCPSFFAFISYTNLPGALGGNAKVLHEKLVAAAGVLHHFHVVGARLKREEEEEEEEKKKKKKERKKEEEKRKKERRRNQRFK